MRALMASVLCVGVSCVPQAERMERDPTAEFHDMGLNDSQIEKIRARLATLDDAMRERDRDARLSAAEARAAACQVPTRTATPQDPVGWWCTTKPDGESGGCTRGAADCKEVRDRMLESGIPTLTECSLVYTAACFRVRRRLAGDSVLDCYSSIGSCESEYAYMTTSARERVDYEVESHCEATK